MSKTSTRPAPIIIKSGTKVSGHGTKGNKVQPFIQPIPSKTYDPNKNGSILVK